MRRGVARGGRAWALLALLALLASGCVGDFPAAPGAEVLAEAGFFSDQWQTAPARDAGPADGAPDARPPPPRPEAGPADARPADLEAVDAMPLDAAPMDVDPPLPDADPPPPLDLGTTPPVPPPGRDALFSRLAVGPEHACGLADAGDRIRCWGAPGEGRLVAPDRLRYFGLAVGGAGGCAFLARDVDCWGDLGGAERGAPDDRFFDELAVGEARVCGRTTYVRDIECWGPQASPPPRVLSGAAALTGGAAHTCARYDNSEVHCWGDDSQRQCAVPPGARFRAVAAGAHHTCGLTVEGAVRCWGAGVFGDLPVPPEVVAGGVTALAAGGRHTCVLNRDRRARCWDVDGRPWVGVPPQTRFQSIGVGMERGCGLTTASVVECWGAWP